ncbi:MAG: ECF-type sigma factor [Planctomycetota bacterium]
MTVDLNTRSASSDVSLLVQRTYADLRRLAERFLVRERRGHTLQATALVHETYLRLANQNEAGWRDRAQFLRVAAEMMRRILVNHERDRRRLKRGGAAARIELEDVVPVAVADPIDLVALDEALVRLQAIDARKVEIVQLRYFAGLTLEETARALDLSVTHVKREWGLAKAWLLRDLEGEGA